MSMDAPGSECSTRKVAADRGMADESYNADVPTLRAPYPGRQLFQEVSENGRLIASERPRRRRRGLERGVRIHLPDSADAHDRRRRRAQRHPDRDPDRLAPPVVLVLPSIALLCTLESEGPQPHQTAPTGIQ
jgi:hypothetical protein